LIRNPFKETEIAKNSYLPISNINFAIQGYIMVRIVGIGSDFHICAGVVQIHIWGGMITTEPLSDSKENIASVVKLGLSQRTGLCTQSTP
jgi:hypothetical protein